MAAMRVAPAWSGAAEGVALAEGGWVARGGGVEEAGGEIGAAVRGGGRAADGAEAGVIARAAGSGVATTAGWGEQAQQTSPPASRSPTTRAVVLRCGMSRPARWAKSQKNRRAFIPAIVSPIDLVICSQWEYTQPVEYWLRLM